MLEQSVITAIGTIVGGTILGFTLSEYSAKRSKKEEIKSVRTLISLEITQNLKSLQELLDKINEERDDLENKGDIDLENIKLKLATKLIEIPPINWKHSMWENQRSLLAISLTEEEIKKVYNIYTSFDDLTSIYSKLLNFIDEDKEYNKTIPTGKFIPISEGIPILSNIFGMHAPAFWTDFEKISLQLLEKGNPLK